MSEMTRPRRAMSDYRVVRDIALRWADQDMYGHVNNVIHYSLMDTAVNGWLIEASGVDIRKLSAVGVVVETGCSYLDELRFPQTISLGIALTSRGRSSVTYEVSLFDENRTLAALGRFVHVYIDQTTRRPVPVPPEVSTALELL